MFRNVLFFGLVVMGSVKADVGIAIGQPGFYGVIELGNAPVPQVVFPQPLLVQPPSVGMMLPQPVYLRVPPGYARHWRWHCHEFNACGRPVYFVRDRWYNQVYVPYYLHGEPHRDWDERRGRGRGERGPGEHRGRD
ncbi:MAG: hypothetical protein KGI47_08150 [Betaproteobacteria bacterium]|nr:hypothetical protein [Betaproteobacteria bacterium]MDE2622652.1 hypothetical protein [Betaproteobacteria bacterium]